MFIENKYTKWYFQIIEHAKQFPVNGYSERHHIIPKSLKGSNSKENIVRLTARQHYICHKLLIKMVAGQLRYKMLEALAIFSNNTTRNLYFNSRDIAKIREANSHASSERNKGNQYYKLRANDSFELREFKSQKNKKSRWVNNGHEERFTMDYKYYLDNGFCFGRLKFSQDHLDKIASSRSHQPRTKEVRDKIRNSHLGKIKTVEHRLKISLAKINQPKQLCEHCGISVDKINYSKWHGDNCIKVRSRPEYTCQHCSIVCTSKANLTRWHGDNCRVKTSS